MSEIRILQLEMDEDDYRAIQEAISKRQQWFCLPDGTGNLAGRVIAEICRGWLELHERLEEEEEDDIHRMA